MDYDKVKRLIIAAFLAILFCVGCNIAGRVHGRKIGYNKGYEAGFVAGYDAPHKADTEYVDKPVYIEKPVPVEIKPAGVEMYPVGTIAQLQRQLDTLAAAKPDTAFVEIPVPVEVKTYADSTYRAQVSGYRPSLDWIEVYQRTTTITQYIDHPAPRWSFGATAGPGVFWSGEVRFGIGVVVGASYRF